MMKKMAPNKWRTFLPCCFKVQNQCVEPQNQNAKLDLSRRRSVSDICSSFSFISDLSNSLIGWDVHVFTLAELKLITSNFSSSNYLGEGGFGTVHKGFIGSGIRPGLEAQAVAVKLLDLNGNQGDKEWLAEVTFLGQLRHPHIVKLIGVCCEDEHRILVYEYMERGNLGNQLFGRYCIPLPWLTRIKIAVGAAKGLAFLHGEQKPVIFRDFKASNILLDLDYTAKLSDFGLAKDGPEGDKTHVTTRVMGTHGYTAPEYIMTGHLTTMSDVFSFGVVLLELLTGKRPIDERQKGRIRKQHLVEWARPLLKDPNKHISRLMDPKLDGQYSLEGAKRAAELANKCLRHHPKLRPTMNDVVRTLEPLLDLDYDIPVSSFIYVASKEGKDANEPASLKKEMKDDEKEEMKEDEKKEKLVNEEETKEVERRKDDGVIQRKGYRRKPRLRSRRHRASLSDTIIYKTERNRHDMSPQAEGNGM